MEHHRHHGPSIAQELARIHERLDELREIASLTLRLVARVTNQEGIIMADLTQLDAAVEQLVEVEADAAAELQALADEVKNLEAGTVTQEQIDAIQQKVTDTATALASATQSAAGGDTPPAE